MKGIHALLKKYQPTTRKKAHTLVDHQTIFHVFSKVVNEEYGRQGAQKMTPEFYKEHILFVSCKQSIWAQELTLQRNTIKKRMNAYFGSTIIEGIKIQ